MKAEFNEIITELQAGKYRPFYYLAGTEPYFQDRLADYIAANAIPEEDRGFNQMILFGNEVKIGEVLDTALRFPMMAERQLVIVKEAQHLNSAEDCRKISAYLDHLQPSTILVFVSREKPDGRFELFKKLGKTTDAVLFISATLYDNQLPGWIIAYCQSTGRRIDADAAAILAESLGSDLSRIAHEVDKMLITLPKGEAIHADLIEDMVGISKDFNIFELKSAIVAKDFLKVNRIADYFASNPKAGPMPLVIITLFSFFNTLLTYHYEIKAKPDKKTLAAILGINPYFMREYEEGAKRYTAMQCANAISSLRAYDLKSKGADNVSTPSGELLREMLFKIMH